jgi:uncharacterized protein (DUF4415 family)
MGLANDLKRGWIQPSSITGRIEMAKSSRAANIASKPRPVASAKARTPAAPTSGPAAKPKPASRVAEPVRTGWATDLVFDVREPKLAVSLRLDADVLRFFRGFGAGYQTRINEVLKAFMQAREGAETASHAVVGARAMRASAGNGKRAR